LSQLGLADLIAVTPEAYADLAAQLATDWDKLSRLREGLRKRMKASALLNTRRFTRNLEEAYRAMWGDTGV
jgi:predicted O-linked N-acetylglucosamine transferase (SPINDLY family)